MDFPLGLTHDNTANTSTAEFGQGTDSESDTTTSSEIVEVSELEKFCGTFRRAQELAVVAAQKSLAYQPMPRDSLVHKQSGQTEDIMGYSS